MTPARLAEELAAGERLAVIDELQRYGDETRTADLVKDGVLPRAIDPEQVADAVVYLASPRASQVLGIVVNLG